MRLFFTVDAWFAKMRVTTAVLVLGILEGLTLAQYLNNRPFPTYSLENMPDTDFTCREKILGGYYADLETDCQMFHVCVKVAGVGVQDFRFLCPNGTAFDQDHQICADWDDVDCDPSTLYYSSDNFDLYRIGSGFESKAVRYGEDEEPFSLQRAETGDVRLNKEKEAQKINQQSSTAPPRRNKKPQPAPPSDSEKDIFKASSSSHFFNNRNFGKEFDEDYEDENINVNQNEDRFQTRKNTRKQYKNQYNIERTQGKQQQQVEAQTSQPKRPTGFLNNFAGSSFSSTTARTAPTTTGYRQRQRQNGDNNDRGNVRTSQYIVSTPAPFKQTQQYNNNIRKTTQYVQYRETEEEVTENYPRQKVSVNEKENYPTTRAVANYNTQKSYIQNKAKTTEPENYPTNFDNQKQKIKKTDNYPTTYSPRSNNQQAQKTNLPNTPAVDNYPTTFSPRTNSVFSQLTQQNAQKQTQPPQTTDNTAPPTQYNPQNYYSQSSTTNDNKGSSKPYSQKPLQTTQQQTQTTQFTHYTPTVPKVTTKYYPTTPAPKFSNRFDETQYDDNADESLNGAHTTNIASSRNELLKSTKIVSTTSTQKPKPYSVTTKSSKEVTQTDIITKPVESSKKPKDYDYAYYDTNVSEPIEYDVQTDIKKSEKPQ